MPEDEVSIDTPTVADLTSPTQSGHPPTPPPSMIEGRYALRQLLGRGGMGEVWAARDLRIDRDVAVKMLRSDGARDDDAVTRFFREALVQGRLEHPSVVPVHDLGPGENSPYFAMKRVAGTTLADVLAAYRAGDDRITDAWPRRLLLTRFVDVCLAIEFAHQRGVIHRDIKPANVILGDFGETYVLDWGLAKIGDDGDSPIGKAGLATDTGSGQTVAGAVLGTPGYMAPEQMRGETVGPRCDIFALGCILFEILAGVAAIPRDDAFELTLAATEHRPRARIGDVPPELDDACARATAADPTNRYRTARQLAGDVQAYLDGDRDLAGRKKLAATHAVRAVEALAAPGDSGRMTAMREAGSALALDAANSDAQRVLARLLLEPPSTMPPEVRARISDERVRLGQAALAMASTSLVIFFVLLPILFLTTLQWSWPVTFLLVLLATTAIATRILAIRPQLIRPAISATLLAAHAGTLGTAGLLFGPLLVLPIVAIGSLVTTLVLPFLDIPKRALAMYALSFVVPLALEWTGLVPSTYRLEGNALVLAPWAVDINAFVLMLAMVIVTVLQMIITTVILTRQRRIQEEAQEKVHLQSWHLGHLLPPSDAPRRN